MRLHLELTYLIPMPFKAPEQKNKPPTFPTVKLLKISLAAIIVALAMAVHLTPSDHIILELTSANAETRAACNEPIKDKTAGLAKPSSTRADCITPQAYVVPRDHHSKMAPLVMTTHP